MDSSNIRFQKQINITSLNPNNIFKRHYSLLKQITKKFQINNSYAYNIKEAGEIFRYPMEIPSLKPNDVLIRIGSVALSGSDVHVFESGRAICPDIALGLDASGTIIEVGECVTDLSPGDRVVMEPGLSCGVCNMCKRGQYCMCPKMDYTSFLSEYQVHPSYLCHKLPCEVSLKEATLTSTLAIGCQACRRARVSPGSNVLVLGSTPTAIASGLCARCTGAQKIIFASMNGNELNWIKRKYCFDIIPFNNNVKCNQLLERIFHEFCAWPDVVINCAVSEETMNLAVMTLQPCGICILAECETEFASFNSLGVLLKNVSIVPSFRSTNMFPAAVHLLKSGHAPMKHIIARTFAWEHIEKAFSEALEIANMGVWRVCLNERCG